MQQEITLEEWAGANWLTLALVFTDIVGSTKQSTDMGDRAWSEVRRAHFAQARRLIEQCGGVEIKTAGDSFFVAFRTAIEAFDFAICLRDDTGHPKVNIRVGVHVGAVRLEDDDAHGNNVNFTKRIMDQAKNGGITLSRDAKSQVDFERASQHSGIRFRTYTATLSGFDGSHDVWLAKTPQMQEELRQELVARTKAHRETSRLKPLPPAPTSMTRSIEEALRPSVTRRNYLPDFTAKDEFSTRLSDLYGSDKKDTDKRS